MNIGLDCLKAIQLKPRYLFGIWLIGSAILFIPEPLATALRIINLRTNHGSWIGLATIAGFCFWLIQAVPTINKYKINWNKKRKVRESIKYLPFEQKVILAYAITKNTQTISLPMGNSAIKPLWSRGIIEGIGDFFACYDDGPCKIRNFVWKHIKKNRGHVLTEEVQDHLKNARRS